MFVIFDMDGVIVDSEVHWKAVEADFLSGLVGRWTDEDQSKIIGMSAHDIYKLLQRDYGLTTAVEDFFSYYLDLAKSLYGTRTQPIPGSLELIADLHRAGVPLAVASSSPHDWISIVVDRFNLKPFFRAIVSSDDVGGKGKPAPDIYQHAVKAFGAVTAQTVAIEDSSKGIASAKAAGLQCVGLLNGHNDHQDMSKADLVVSGFESLTVARLKGLIS